MKKSKFIEDEDRLAYKQRLKEWMQQTNPKPTEEQIETLKQQYLEKRNVKQ